MQVWRAKVDHQMSREVMLTIGNFIVSFAEIEYALKLGIQTLVSCSSPHKGIITADKNVSELIIMLREIYRTSDNQRVPFETIDELCGEADQIRVFRNDLLHATLTAIDSETIELDKRPRNKGYKHKTQEVNLTKLNDMVDKSQCVAGDLICIWMGYHKVTPRVI